MPDPIKLERKALAVHIDTPLEVREQSVALSVKASRISGVLKNAAALPEMRERAKAQLVELAREALALWGEL